MKRSLPLEPKGQNFSTQEKLLLLELISSHGRQLVEENDTLSIFRRSRIWRVVYTEFNQHQEVSQRTEKQLRLLWKNLKARCKREFRLNASKYNVPSSVISDPILKKMSTLIGIEGDIPTKYGRYGDTSVARKVTKSSISSFARKPTTIRPPQQRSMQNQSLEPGPSQIQITKSYSMAAPTHQDMNHTPPVLIGSPNSELTATVSVPSQVKLSRVNMATPVLIHDRMTAGTSDSDQIHITPGPGTNQKQIRTGDTSSSSKVHKVDELTFSRRKKAIPRKASKAIKSEVMEIEDDVIDLEMSKEICGDYSDEIRDSDSTKQSNGDGWLEDAEGPAGDLTGTHLQVEDATCSGLETSHDTVMCGAIPQNNLHHHMPIRSRKPIKLQVEHKECHLPDDYLKTEEGIHPEEAEEGEGALNKTLLHDEGQDAGLGNTEAKDFSTSEKEMLTMARKEHDMKMTTMLMKRKQIMQIKRREHLAKMENHRLNKEILRLKKRKLELEIRNSLYLEEVEDDFDS